MSRRILVATLVLMGGLSAGALQAANEITPRRITLPTENLAKEAYLTVPRGQWVAALSYEYEILEDALNGKKLAENSENSFTLNNTLALDISYGLSDNVTLSAIVPYKYVYNTREVDSALVAGTPGIFFSDRRGSQGLGDIIVMSYLRIRFGSLVRFGDEYYPAGDDGYDDYIGHGPSTYAGRYQGPIFALSLGVRLPTGSTDVTDQNGNRLADELQLGSGTMDPIVGLLYHQRYYRLGWGTSAVYRFASQENIYHYEGSDEFVGAAYISYRLNRNLEWVNQANGNILGKSKLNGVKTENSGGTILFYTPSLVYVGAKNFTLQASAEIPIYRKFNKTQLSSDYIINLRTAFAFD